jgi:puromycin-sensitive aminopeptidase
LITYRDTALLVDPDHTSAAAKQYVALVVGHELAHQWFGNLVTMEWWTHLWLNEGFATWIEYLCVDECFPDYDIWTQFCTADFARALELDALRHSHPIEVPIGHPDEINEIFDAVSYSKGASIIRMLHTYIGDAAFRKGMNSYLTKHQYSNAGTGDLWAALEQASGEKVAEIMSTWTEQLGYPVVKVTELKDRATETTRFFQLEQQKFAFEHNSPEEFASFRWNIPIRVISASSPAEPIAKLLVT